MTTKPVLFVVDDEPTALAAIESDLRRAYGADFRIVCATSGSEALETLKQLKLYNEPVTFLLIDQRMPHMTGVELVANSKSCLNSQVGAHNDTQLDNSPPTSLCPRTA